MPKFKVPSDRLIKIPEVRIKYTDIFNGKMLYQTLWMWLQENGWVDEEERGNHYETYYFERTEQNGMKELFIRWRMFKSFDNTPAFNFYLDFDFHWVNISNTEVIVEGQKLKVNKGIMELYIRPYIEEVYKKNLAGNKLTDLFLNLFTRRIYRRTVEMKKKALYRETYELHNFLKQWFKLKRYLPYEEHKNFYPSYAWPSHIKKE